MRIYLAGPITGLTYKGAVDWRNAVRDELDDLGHVGVSPMRGKEYLENYYADRVLSRDPSLGYESNETATLKLSYEEFPMSSAKGIFGRDTFDVRNCDILLANFLGADTVSIGTVMEIQRAFDLDKYVLTVMEWYNPHQHPFVVGASSLVVADLETAMQVIGILGDVYK